MTPPPAELVVAVVFGTADRVLAELLRAALERDGVACRLDQRDPTTLVAGDHDPPAGCRLLVVVADAARGSAARAALSAWAAAHAVGVVVVRPADAPARPLSPASLSFLRHAVDRVRVWLAAPSAGADARTSRKLFRPSGPEFEARVKAVWARVRGGGTVRGEVKRVLARVVTLGREAWAAGDAEAWAEADYLLDTAPGDGGSLVGAAFHSTDFVAETEPGWAARVARDEVRRARSSLDEARDLARRAGWAGVDDRLGRAARRVDHLLASPGGGAGEPALDSGGETLLVCRHALAEAEELAPDGSLADHEHVRGLHELAALRAGIGADPQQTLDRLEALPASVRGTPDGARLAAECLRQVGMRGVVALANQGRFEDALTALRWIRPPDPTDADAGPFAEWLLRTEAQCHMSLGVREFQENRPTAIDRPRRALKLLACSVVDRHHDLRRTAEDLYHQMQAAERAAERVRVPGDRVDHVHFSVTAPPAAPPGAVFVVDVWAHLEAQREQVVARAREQAGGEPVQVRTQGPVAVARGVTLTVTLRVSGLTVADPEGTVLWTGGVGNVSFGVEVPADAAPGGRAGVASVRIDGLEVARVAFVLRVGPAAGTPAPVATEERRYRRAFVSYASPDRDTVLATVQGIQKAAPGLDVFLDVLSLRAGRDWAAALREEIPRNDVFYLFWSAHARASEWVEREWRCALAARGRDFIDPVPLAPPDEVPPPPELAGQHFNDWTLAFRRRPAR